MVVTCIFSFLHSIFYPFQHKFQFFTLKVIFIFYKSFRYRIFTHLFWLFQTERICRQQFWNFEENLKKVLQQGRKHCYKQFLFPHSVSKRLALQTHKNKSFLGKRLSAFNLVRSEISSIDKVLIHPCPLTLTWVLLATPSCKEPWKAFWEKELCNKLLLPTMSPILINTYCKPFL